MERSFSLSDRLNELLTGAAGKFGPSLVRPDVAFLTGSLDRSRLKHLQKQLFCSDPAWPSHVSRLSLGVVPQFIGDEDFASLERKLSRSQWVIADLSHESLREFFEKFRKQETSFSKSYPRLCLGYGDLSEERIREMLFSVRIEGPGRHMIHSLQIRDLNHLPIKRVVAEYWVKVCSLLAAGKGVLPSISMTVVKTERNQTDPDHFWKLVCQRAVLACYCLAHEHDFASEPTSHSSELRLADMVRAARQISLGFAKAKMMRTALRRTPKLVFKSMPWVTGVWAAATLVASGRRTYADCKEYGMSLIDEVEARWRESLEGEHVRS